MTNTTVLTAAVEGVIDEAALRRICQVVGTGLGNVYGRSGKRFVLDRLRGYNHSARYRHWVVLVDLDQDHRCAPGAAREWLAAPAPLMSFRIAVREIEAWLLADRERIAQFLRVGESLIPAEPESVTDPKLEIINAARRSRSRAIREDIVPSPRAGQAVGPAYTARMIEFITDLHVGWRPHVAARRSGSLQRCIAALGRLIQRPFPVRQQ